MSTDKARETPETNPAEDKQEGETLAAVRQLAADIKRRAPTTRQRGVGAAIGVGSAAVVAALLYWRGNRK